MTERAAGILLHPTSLAGPHGAGELREAAYRLIEWLVRARQSVWQVLPLGPTGFGNSPYVTRSAFAGNTLLISLDALRERGWLHGDHLADPPTGDPDRIDFDRLLPWKTERLRRAFARFEAEAAASDRQEQRAFAQREAGWLDDFAAFMALREAHQGEPW